MKKLIFLFLPVVILSSCNDGIVEPNPRESAIGSYTYTAKTYALDLTNDQLFYLETDHDFTGTFTISATPSNQDEMIIEGSGNKIAVNNLARIQNGFAFNINDQLVLSNGNSYMITGYQGVALTSEGKAKTYDGSFFRDTNRMQFYLQTSLQDNTMVVEFNLTRN